MIQLISEYATFIDHFWLGIRGLFSSTDMNNFCFGVMLSRLTKVFLSFNNDSNADFSQEKN